MNTTLNTELTREGIKLTFRDGRAAGTIHQVALDDDVVGFRYERPDDWPVRADPVYRSIDAAHHVALAWATEKLHLDDSWLTLKAPVLEVLKKWGYSIHAYRGIPTRGVREFDVEQYADIATVCLGELDAKGVAEVFGSLDISTEDRVIIAKLIIPEINELIEISKLTV